MVTPAALDGLTVLGPFFAVHVHLASSAVAAPWHAMSELVEDPDLLRDRVLAVRAHLATAAGQQTEAVPLRVAASVTHLGLVARLVSPALAVAVATGGVLNLNLRCTRWQPSLGGAFPLSIQTPTPMETDSGQRSQRCAPDQLAAMLTSTVIGGPVRELVTATRPLSVSARILWGNVASAVNGAAAMIATTRPSWAHRAHALGSLVLGQAPLRGTSTRTPDGQFRRRSCCLIYRAAPNSTNPVCGDCVLAGDRPR
jgi:FhuF 2Fe-2S C-terminal domain